MDKGVLQVQLNWIFVVFVGVIILVFFIMIVQRQKVGFSEKSEFLFKEDVMDLIVGAESAERGSFKIAKPKGRIRLSPGEITVGNLKSSLASSIVFGPEEIPAEERELIFGSIQWEVPFPAAKFVFLTSPSVRYVFVWDENDQLASSFNELYNDPLFEFIFKDRISLNELSSYDNRNVFTKFIVLTSDASTLDIRINNVPSEEHDLMVVVPDGNMNDKYVTGGIRFYYRGFDQGTSEFLGRATLIGAIFVEQLETYETLMTRASQQVYAINKILAAKNERLVERNVCPIFETMRGYLRNYDSFVGSLINDWGNVQSMRNQILDIEWANEQIFIQSCPYLY